MLGNIIVFIIYSGFFHPFFICRMRRTKCWWPMHGCSWYVNNQGSSPGSTLALSSTCELVYPVNLHLLISNRRGNVLFHPNRSNQLTLFGRESITFDLCLLLTQYWTDIYLTWNPESYPGVQNLRFPSDQVWTPDILLYNRSELFWPCSLKASLSLSLSWSLWLRPVWWRLFIGWSVLGSFWSQFWM